MKAWRLSVLWICTLAGCATGSTTRQSHKEYTAEEKANSKTVNLSKDQLWEKLIPAIGKSFFSINNVDKASGFINLTFSGDPQRYVDCGSLMTSVKNLWGPREYQIDLAAAESRYEAINNNDLFQIYRKLTLEGKINLVVEKVNTGSKITVNTRYVLSRMTESVGGMDDRYRRIRSVDQDSVGFDSNTEGIFNGGTKCVSNGRLEKEILDLVQ